MANFDPRALEALKILLERPEAMAAALAVVAKQDAVRVDKPTLRRLWDEWAPWAEQTLAPNTWLTARRHRAVYERTFVTFEGGDRICVADLAWDQLTPHFANLFRAARQRSSNGRKGKVGPATVNRQLCTMQSMLNYFVRTKKSIPYNPLAGWTRIDEEQFARKTYLTDAQMKKYVAAGCPMFQDVMTVIYRLGMRQAEARELRKSEVNFEAHAINLPAGRSKNRTGRTIPMPHDVEAIIRQNCTYSRGPLVFVAPTDPARQRVISSRTWQNWAERARDRSGVTGFNGEKVVTHTGRHKAATDLIQAGVPETSVQAALGMSPSTLKRYSKFAEPQQDAMRARMEAMLAAPTEITESLKRGRRPAVGKKPHLRAVKPSRAE